MSLTLNDTIVTACIVIIALTLAAFAYVQHANPNPNFTRWIRMNQFAALTIALTLCSIIPQYFLLGRTGPECRRLHHFAGTLYYATNGMVRLFFVVRSNAVVTPNTTGRLLTIAVAFFMICGVVGFNLTVNTAVSPDLGFCMVLGDPLFSLLFLFVIPFLLDLIINIRFIYRIFKSFRFAQIAADTAHSRATMRLLRVTCLLSFSCMVVTMLSSLTAFNIIPLQDISLLTPMQVFEQAYNACAMAWPAIIIKFLKRNVSSLSRTAVVPILAAPDAHPHPF